jgi:hypothetical protein
MMAASRPRHALVVGFDYYGRFLAQLMNEQSKDWRLTYCSASRLDTLRAAALACRVDAVISFGGPGPNAAITDIARRRNIPVVVIWAGTDVVSAAQERHLLEVIKNYRFVNVADGPWLVDELRELGIEARYVPVTAVAPPATMAPLPHAFRVLTYLPEPRRPFYGEKIVYSIARSMPDVPFTVVGKGEPNAAAPSNVTFAGHVDDMPARIDAVSVLLRLPEHDGKSMLVLEALSRGRHVIWNYDFPGVHHAADGRGALALLRAMREAHQSGQLPLNAAGREHVTQRFNRPALAKDFQAVLDEAIPGTTPVEAGARHVAISGLDLFAAQVARALEELPLGWAVDPLRTRARLEVLSSLLSVIRCDVWYSIGAPIGDRWVHLLARFLGKPRVIHWVGSDIVALKSNARLRAWCRLRRVRNLAEVTWTRDELRSFGIDAEIAPLPPRLAARSVPPMPERFTVLFYLPRTRGAFYGRREYERLIRAFAHRNVRFMAAGGGDFYAPPEADVVRLGWKNVLDDVYAQSSVLVRFTARDGLSLMVLEALTHGRHVLWTQPFAHVTAVNDYAQLERAVGELLDRHERGALEPQYAAAEAVLREYDPQRCITRIVSTWDDAMHQRPHQTALGAVS